MLCNICAHRRTQDNNCRGENGKNVRVEMEKVGFNDMEGGSGSRSPAETDREKSTSRRIVGVRQTADGRKLQDEEEGEGIYMTDGRKGRNAGTPENTRGEIEIGDIGRNPRMNERYRERTEAATPAGN